MRSAKSCPEPVPFSYCLACPFDVLKLHKHEVRAKIDVETLDFLRTVVWLFSMSKCSSMSNNIARRFLVILDLFRKHGPSVAHLGVNHSPLRRTR